MSSTTYTITEARARISELLRRAKAGEEIVITKGQEPQARILPLATSGRREAAPLRHLHLPDDLFDHDDAEQASRRTPRRNPSETISTIRTSG